MHGGLQGVIAFDAACIDRQVADYLRRCHVGRANAITLDELARTFSLARRDMHDRVARLVIRDRELIGTSSRTPAGVFIIADTTDLEIATRHLWSRSMDMLRRYSILRRLSLDHLLGQVRLDLQEPKHGNE